MRKHLLSMLILYAIAMAAVSVGCNRTAGPARDRNVTKANFDKINNGMSKAEVKAILGGPVQVRMPGEGGPAEFVTLNDVEADEIHAWKADPATDTKRIEIGFKDGKVVVKSQTGL